MQQLKVIFSLKQRLETKVVVILKLFLNGQIYEVSAEKSTDLFLLITTYL